MLSAEEAFIVSADPDLRPYRWENSDLLTTLRNALPNLNVAEAERLVAEIEALLASRGEQP